MIRINLIIIVLIVMLITVLTSCSNKKTTAPTDEPTNQCATPTFSPSTGTYLSAQNVSISCSTSGATIKYALNGSTPTTTSTSYSSPISVNSNTIIKAKAFKTGWNDSSVATATYTINTSQTIATPTFSPSGGTYSSAPSVSISCATSGATIRYTTNGNDPSPTSSIYSNPLLISSTTTLKAKAFKNGWIDSNIGTAIYTIEVQNDWVQCSFPQSLNGTWDVNYADHERFHIDGVATPIYITDYDDSYSLFIGSITYKNGSQYRIQVQQQQTFYAHTFFFNNITTNSMSICKVTGYVLEPLGTFISCHKD